MYREYDFNGAVRGEYVFGDDVYIDDDYMDELWKQYRGFPEYWVSTHGRVRSDYEQRSAKGWYFKYAYLEEDD